MPVYDGRVRSLLTCLSRSFLADIPQVNPQWQWQPYQLPIRDRAIAKGIEVQDGD
jgi:hypothetical protein